MPVPQKIPLKVIKTATDNFNEKNCIGDGFLGKSYGGQLSLSGELTDVAVRRLDYSFQLQELAFEKEISFLSQFEHKNIVSMVGFCYENNEMLIINKRVGRGSLRSCLSNPSFTWLRRLNISVGVASALSYLHNDVGPNFTVIHHNINMNTILVDKNWEAKISGFEQSMRIPPGDLDLAYEKFGMGIYKSDVFSMGIVLFQLLCGREAFFSGEDNHFQASSAIFHYENGELHKFVDPDLFSQMDQLSFKIFSKTAYKCLIKQSAPPNMHEILKRLERAMKVQQMYENKEHSTVPLRAIPDHFDLKNHGSDSINTIGSHQGQNGKRFNISPSEIELISKYDPETNHGQLPGRFQNHKPFLKKYMNSDEFHLEIDMTRNFQHENIVRSLGYSTYDLGVVTEEKIVYEYANNGSLYSLLESPEKIGHVTWAQRLKICLGAARGLKCLHLGIGDRGTVIHRNFSSKKILLDDNMEAKIYDFTKSVLVPRNQQQVYHPIVDLEKEWDASTKFWVYIDPVYRASGFLSTEVDIYPFGSVMFELLTGKTLYDDFWLQLVEGTDHATFKLTTLVREYYYTDPFRLVDPDIINQADSQSIHKYMELAYKCISLNLMDRPSLNTIVKTIEKLLIFQNNGFASTSAIHSLQSKNLEDLEIPLEVIENATENFKTKIGYGGFGNVYKGTLTERWQNRTAAIKCLKPEFQQGIYQFRKELEFIFNFQHKNVIPLIGYCSEGKEMIIVTDYAENGSLDSHLLNPDKKRRLTWDRRLKICLGAAKGLQHLHLGDRDGNKLIHRDLKTANILLDENMEAKICDFGLSRSVTTNDDTGLYTSYGGTEYYTDPIYRETGKLRTASDVYSFGVVLFEMLSGRMAHIPVKTKDGKTELFISTVRRLKWGTLDQLIDPLIKEEADDRSIFTFQDIAYQCISMNYKKRPTMDKIIDRIEEADAYQIHKD